MLLDGSAAKAEGFVVCITPLDDDVVDVVVVVVDDDANGFSLSTM
jgi:hypothetical protein